MKKIFGAAPLWEVSADLSMTASGISKADTVIKNAQLVNVCTGEIIKNIDVAIKLGRIALVGSADHTIGENTNVIDAKGKYIAPGFMDGHIHIESSMLCVGEYAKAVISHGTTAIFMDPHEMCNVTGLDGVKCMIEDAKRTHLKAFLTTPSCVPAVPGFEDTGAVITSEDVKETMTWPETAGLGEMMNFPAINAGDKNIHAIVDETLKAEKVVTGHYSLPEHGSGLNAYIASGARCCHETTRKEDALEKMRLGMYVMMREGSAWHDLAEVAKSITENHIDTRFAVLVSDDAHPETLMRSGHMDHIVRRAVQEGINPVTAIQMATINCAACFKMDHEMGSVTPGKCADIIMFDDLENINICMTMINGAVIAENGQLKEDFAEYKYPDFVKNSIHIKGDITKDTFVIPCEKEEVKVRVIEVIPAKTSTIERHEILKCKDGSICADTDKNILKAAVFERHKETGKTGFGFIKGFNIKKGAIATTVSHDAHNLLVLGTNDEDMSLAANIIKNAGGGLTAVADGKELATVELPLAGLMSEAPIEEMEKKVAALSNAWKELGCDLPSPFMTMSILALACLPELRLTNRGLIDCVRFEKVPLIIEN